MMCCNRPVLKTFRAVAVAYADYTVNRSEDRLQSLTDRLKDIRHEFVVGLQALRLTRILMADAEFEYDVFADTVKDIAVKGLEVRPQAVGEQAERVTVKVVVLK